MSNYRRWRVPGGTYFFTLVTEGRVPLFADRASVGRLRSALRDIRRRRPFTVIAVALLPDHLHFLWRLPDGDDDFSTRFKLFKERFTRRHLFAGGPEAEVTASKLRRGERGVWLRRFWEHLCRDDFDLKRHLDYIHWNPVKHGYVQSPKDWKYSSFRRWVRLGEYDLNWGAGIDPQIDIPAEFD